MESEENFTPIIDLCQRVYTIFKWYALEIDCLFAYPNFSTMVVNFNIITFCRCVFTIYDYRFNRVRFLFLVVSNETIHCMIFCHHDYIYRQNYDDLSLLQIEVVVNTPI